MYNEILTEIPEELRMPEVFLAAVQNNRWALEYMPEKLKTPELCHAALRIKD